MGSAECVGICMYAESCVRISWDCGPHLCYHQTTHPDGEPWIMICLSVCHASGFACSAPVSEEQHGTCGGGKVCVCKTVLHLALYVD